MPTAPLILLVGEDDALIYLIERYAERGGFRLRVTAAPTAEVISELGPAAVWFASLESLEGLRPRETGLVDHDAPLVVCTSTADERRARELGADYCVVHPLAYSDFMAAMAAVGRFDGQSAAAR